MAYGGPKCQDQMFSGKALKDTFFFSNACPQQGKLNRVVWLKLERHIRNLIQKDGYESVKVITGPLFLPTILDGKKYVMYQVIGENNVAVPTHFFKFVEGKSGKDEEEKIEQWAYVLPNSSFDISKELDDYLVPISELEKISGLVLLDEGGMEIE